MSEPPRNPELALDDGLDEELSALIDGELPAARAEALRARVAAEPVLAARLRELESVDLALRALPEAQPHARLRARVRDRIAGDAGDGAAKGRLIRLPLWGGAALAAAAAVAFFLLSPGTTGVPVGPDAGAALEPDLAGATDEEIGIALDYETLADLEVIEELDLLELMVELDESAGETGGRG
jgi:anti-sigma factor RsiW